MLFSAKTKSHYSLSSFLVILFASHTLHSATQTTLPEVKTEMPKTEAPNSTSSMNRENKRYSLLVGMGGETTTFAGHFAADYFINRNMVLQLKGVRESGDKYVDGTENSVNVGLKVFEGNSFYFKPSIGYLEYSKVDAITAVFNGIFQTVSEPDQLSAITGSLAIGNQWQWSTFTLGVEWVGITQTLATLDYANDPRKTFLTALQLSLGASF